jgi:hypothetical protein
MSDLPTKYDLTKRELARGRNLKLATVASPLVLTAIPAVVSLILFLFFASSPPVAATIFFLGLILTAIGFLKGTLLAGLFGYRYSRWKNEMREKIAADGIKASEIDWFRRELRSQERRALKEIERRDLMLGDAYRETLASRLTASRIIKTTRRELLNTRRRENKIKQLMSENAQAFLDEIAADARNIESIHDDAKLMLAEAESRLQMIEAAALRGGGLADTEMALRRLAERRDSLPLALEEARIASEIRAELEDEEREKTGSEKHELG